MGTLSKHIGNVCGTTAIGERGQVVIPKELRHRLKLKAGDKFLVIEHHGKIVLVPETEMRDLIAHFTAHLSK